MVRISSLKEVIMADKAIPMEAKQGNYPNLFVS